MIINYIMTVRFEVVTGVVMNSSVFWDIVPYSPFKIQLTCSTEMSVDFQRTIWFYIPCVL
jgi:hypothetical protein